ADLAVHGQPAAVADRPRGADFRPRRVGQLPGQLDVFARLDAASHGDDDLGLGQIYRLLGLAEALARPSPYLLRGQLALDLSDLRGPGASPDRVFAERSRLERNQVRRVARKFHVSVELALEHLTNEEQPSVLLAIAQAVAREAAVKRGGQLWREVPHL